MQYMKLATWCVVCLLSGRIYGEGRDTLHLRWDWSSVDNGGEINRTVEALRSRGNFVLGAATAEYQILGELGLPASALASAEPLMEMLQNQQKPGSFTRSGNACNGWEKRFEDIALLEELGMNAYRFSVDWSKVQPHKGQVDYAVLGHYRLLCQELRARGMRVMVTLHHFVNPRWFADLGGFEREENIRFFVDFCKNVYDALADDVDWWCTINEPGVYILQGYLRGVMPPFYSIPFFRKDWAPSSRQSRKNLALAEQVLANLLKAHVQAYALIHRLFKEGRGAHVPQVGFAHQYLYFESYHGSWDPRNLIERMVAGATTQWINLSILEALRTEKLSFTGVPGPGYTLPGLAQSLDYIGLNYYSHVFFDVMRGKDQPGRYAGTIMTDMPYEIYAEGLFRAIQDMASFKVPLYITENGIADRFSGGGVRLMVDRREIWIKRYLAAVAYAIEQGYDVRGYFYWSLMDNWEWDMTYGPRFGLYHVDFSDPKKPRTLRKNAYVMRDIAQAVTGVGAVRV